MPNTLKHKFTSTKTDSTDATEVQPSDWNDEHVFGGGGTNGDILVFVTANSDKVGWLSTVASGAVLVSQGVGSTPAWVEGTTNRLLKWTGTSIGDSIISDDGSTVTIPGALVVDEILAKVFTADLEQALAGGQIITKSVSVVSQTFTAPGDGGTATLWVKDLPSAGNMAVFEANDWVVLRTFSRASGTLTIADCVGQVTAYTDGSGANEGQQSWTFTRGIGASAGTISVGTNILADNLVLDYGASGNGFYEVNASDGAYGINSPYAQIVTWATSPVTANKTIRVRLGHLKGITSVTNEFGIIIGTYTASPDDTSKFFRASTSAFELHGVNFLLYSGSTNVFKIDRTAPSLAIGSPVPSAYGTGNGIWMGKDGSAYKLRAGDPSGNRITWDGTVLTVYGPDITVGSNSAEGGAASGLYKFSKPTGTTYTASDVFGIEGWGNTIGSGTRGISIFNKVSQDTAVDIDYQAYVDIRAQGWRQSIGGQSAQAIVQLTSHSSATTSIILISATDLNIYGTVNLGNSSDPVIINTTSAQIQGKQDLVFQIDYDNNGSNLYKFRANASSTDLMTLNESGTLLHIGGLTESGMVTAAQITADQNNYNPGHADKRIVRLSSDASRTITGLTSISWARLTLTNGGSSDIVLAHNSSSSSTGNKFICPGAVNFTLNIGDSVDIYHDDTNNFWILVAY